MLSHEGVDGNQGDRGSRGDFVCKVETSKQVSVLLGARGMGRRSREGQEGGAWKGAVDRVYLHLCPCAPQRMGLATGWEWRGGLAVEEEGRGRESGLPGLVSKSCLKPSTQTSSVLMVPSAIMNLLAIKGNFVGVLCRRGYPRVSLVHCL